MENRSQRIAFRSLTLADMTIMSEWLSDPDVATWYREGVPTIGNLTGKYAAVIDGTEPTRGYITRIDSTDIGYIQAVPIDGYPDYARQMKLDRGAIGIDLFIGDPAWRHRGWGGPILQVFLERVVFGELQAPLAVIAPEPANARAIRAYEKAGFRWLKTVCIENAEDPDESGDEYIMILKRVGKTL